MGRIVAALGGYTGEISAEGERPIIRNGRAEDAPAYETARATLCFTLVDSQRRS